MFRFFAGFSGFRNRIFYCHLYRFLGILTFRFFYGFFNPLNFALGYFFLRLFGLRCVVMASSHEYGVSALYSDFRYMDWIEEFNNYLRVWDALNTIVYQLRWAEGVDVETKLTFRNVTIR